MNANILPSTEELEKQRAEVQSARKAASEERMRDFCTHVLTARIQEANSQLNRKIVAVLPEGIEYFEFKNYLDANCPGYKLERGSLLAQSTSILVSW